MWDVKETCDVFQLYNTQLYATHDKNDIFGVSCEKTNGNQLNKKGIEIDDII